MTALIDTAEQRIDRPLFLDCKHVGDFTVPAQAGKGNIDIDTASNVHAIKLYWTASGTAATVAEMKSDIGLVEVYLGGNLMWHLTGTQIIDLYKHYNDKIAALGDFGVLPLIFTPNMFDLSERTRGYALGMMSDADPTKQNKFRVEVTMLSPGSLTVDACEVHLETDRFPSSQLGTHVRWLEHADSWATATKQRISNMQWPANCKAAYAYHVFETQVVSRVHLTVDDIERIKNQPDGLLDQRANRAGRVPQSGYTHIDFCLENDPRAFLSLQNNVNHVLELTWAVAPNDYTILRQLLCDGLV